MSLIDFRAEVRGKGARILLCEPDPRVLRAARTLKDERLCEPILVGDETIFRETAQAAGVDLSGVAVVPIAPERFAQAYHGLRAEKDHITLDDAKDTLKDPAFFSCMLLAAGEADGLVAGATWPTANTIRPALKILRGGLALSYFLMRTGRGEYVFADCAFNVQPSEDELAEIAVRAALEAEKLGLAPRVALLSFSTEGSAHHPDQEKVMRATHAARERARALGKSWPIGGELQVDAAMDAAVAEAKAPDSPVKGDANVFIFPDLDAGNIGYKLVQRFCGAEAVGPVITGLKKPVNDLSRGCSDTEIVDVCCITAWQALTKD